MSSPISYFLCFPIYYSLFEFLILKIVHSFILLGEKYYIFLGGIQLWIYLHIETLICFLISLVQIQILWVPTVLNLFLLSSTSALQAADLSTSCQNLYLSSARNLTCLLILLSTQQYCQLGTTTGLLICLFEKWHLSETCRISVFLSP